MSAPAHPHAMQPRKPGSTRTAPGRRPARFPFGGRYLAYTAFDLTGIVYLLAGFVVLGIVWSLGSGAPAWSAQLERLRHPAYVVFHLLVLASVIGVGVRFFRLFPKAQPPRIGPAKPPPAPVIVAALYGAWVGVTLLFVLVLAGGIF